MTAAPITRLDVSAFTIPTDAPESDGTLRWTSTTLVLVELTGGGERSLGYTYADLATAVLIREHFRELVVGRDVLELPSITASLGHAVRNLGLAGVAAMAVSAVDVALWDLKARVHGRSLAALLGSVVPPCRSTAAAASPPTTTGASRPSWAAGWTTACPGSR